MVAIILAALTVLLALLVVGQALTGAAAYAAASTVEQAQQVNPTTGEGSQCDAFDECVYDPLCPFYARCVAVQGDEPYAGRHRAPDAEATTVLIARAALTRPYATGGVR